MNDYNLPTIKLLNDEVFASDKVNGAKMEKIVPIGSLIGLPSFQLSFPVNLKVIGIGSGTTDIIEEVKSFGYDCVGCLVTNDSADCVPTDEDMMVIIIAKGNEDVTNEIAKTYHDAGVLTFGLVPEADYSCFDSVATETTSVDFPETIKNLLLPLVTYGYMCYDFYDLCTILRNSHSFSTLTANGRSVEEAIANMQGHLENIDLQDIESLLAHIYVNHKANIKNENLVRLSSMISNLPESINVIWSVNFDDTLPDDLIRFIIIMSGKEL